MIVLVFEAAAAGARVVAADLWEGRCLTAYICHPMHNSPGVCEFFRAPFVPLEKVIGTATFEAPARNGVCIVDHASGHLVNRVDSTADAPSLQDACEVGGR